MYGNLVIAALMNKIHHQLKTIYVRLILQYAFSVYILMLRGILMFIPICPSMSFKFSIIL